jgi:hypothetical protein
MSALGQKQTTQRLLSVDGGSSAYIFSTISKLGNFGQLNLRDTVSHRDGMSALDLGGHRHEIVVKLCRALSCRYPVNCIAVRSERDGSVANRNRLRHPASQHHGRRAEAGGKATEAAADGKATTEADAGDKHGCISPDIANRSNAICTANRSNAGACERFSNGEVCRA